MHDETKIAAGVDDARNDIFYTLEDALERDGKLVLDTAARDEINAACDRLEALAFDIRNKLFDHNEVEDQVKEARAELREEFRSEHSSERQTIEAVSRAANKVLGHETVDESIERWELRRALRDLRALVRGGGTVGTSIGPPALWRHE
jgi:preprotein translocase subunit SecA